MPPMSGCTACMDDDEEVAFRCKGKGGVCAYQLCAGCVRIAFEDSSGGSSSLCALCGTPSALDMIASVCGQGAIRAVENKLRGKVEFQLQAENIKKEESRSNARDLNDRARKLFNELAEKINLKCPRCQTAFHDYDGCNALRCGVSTCRAAFCALCLKDCGTDAHKHVYDIHKGQIFDKAAFEQNKINRAKAQIDILKDTLAHESFELQQLVLNHIEKAKLTQDCSVSSKYSTRKTAFLEKTKESLFLATRSDRLSLLSTPEDYRLQTPLSREHISPRCAVPPDYRLSLIPKEGDVYRVSLENHIIEDIWEKISDVEAHFKANPKVESLLNICQTLRCAVVAFEGHSHLYQTSKGNDIAKGERTGEDEVCIRFQPIDSEGNVSSDVAYFGHRGRMSIAGLNQNKRMVLLERHVRDSSSEELLYEPLLHLIGAGQPTSVFTEMDMEIPDTQSELNEEQRKVAHPLLLKTAVEVAGPPGTGKTKTIVELVRALLQCTSYDLLLLSERNGAINAVAEKFKNDCLKMNGKKAEITDQQMWRSVMTYGSGESMGNWTRMFTLEEKLKCHPELVDLEEKHCLLLAASKNLSQTLRDALADIVERFGQHFNEAYAKPRSEEIRKDKVELTSPLGIIGTVHNAVSDMKNLFSEAKDKGSKYVFEDSASDVVVNYSILFGRLIYIRTDAEKKDKKIDPWNAKEATKRLGYLALRLNEALELNAFCPNNARSLYNEKTSIDEELKALRQRLQMELPKCARLHMSTIGSSHRLPGNQNDTDNESDIEHLFSEMTFDEFSNDEAFDSNKDTIVIFDESGCIPSYELLGLTRLGRSIKALVLVGDKHQLPPYDPMQGRRYGRSNSFSNSGRASKSEKLLSLLDSSTLTTDTGKVMLTTQYRVPKDIADMLNRRVYRGQYNTCPVTNVPISGLFMVDVPWSESPRKKYVNPNEVRKGLDVLRRLSLDRDISSTLIITPYKNQQREFEFQIQRDSMQVQTDVLTIDQCQGQEADAVILSLVRRPTRFLTLNRLNVALSRVRKKLYVLTDFKDLKNACRDEKWDCASLAADLLINDY